MLGEFPWICVVIAKDQKRKKRDRFVSACAIVPDDRNNDIDVGTHRVITVARRLQDVAIDE